MLRERIAVGEFTTDKPLPAEPDLAHEYRVGRDTIRDALAILRNDGLIITRRGYRATVAEYGEKEPLMVESGSSVSARPPTPEERRELDVPEGWPVLQVVHPDGSGDVYAAHRFRVVTQ